MNRAALLLTLAALSAVTPAAQATGFPQGFFQRRACGAGLGQGNQFGVLEAVGLTADQRLICFNADVPTLSKTIGTVSGLSGDTQLIGIDYRPKTGELYGVGDAGGVYTIDLDDAAATFKFDVALEGASFGVDFNPAADRLRIVSGDTGQNLRINVDTGMVTEDTDLSYMPSAMPPPVAQGVTGTAYTNNDDNADTGTTLFDIDAMLDQVVIQAPPNAGALNPTGKLLVDSDANVGFDIYSTVRGGRTLTNTAYASLTVGARARMYRINLFTGQASLRGTFSSKNQVLDIALPLNQL